MGTHSRSLDAVMNMIRSLEEDIVLGRLYPRERLIEDQLAERFKQKRHVVRQVLNDLETIGLVVRESGKGAIVREYAPDEVNNLYQMREIVEGQAALMIALPVPRKDIAILEELCNTYAQSVADGDMRSVIETNKVFHQTIYRLCGNPFLFDVIDNMAQRSNLVRFSSSADPVLLEQARDEHFGILRALKGRNNERLKKLCLEHIQPSRIRYLERYKRTERNSGTG